MKIPSNKYKMTNKIQIQISNDPNKFGIWFIGYCDLFVICVLLFGISQFQISQGIESEFAG